MLPLGRQHSLLNIINVVIHKLGHLIHSYLPKVLQILLCVTATVSTLLDKRVHVSMTDALGVFFVILLSSCILCKCSKNSSDSFEVRSN